MGGNLRSGGTVRGEILRTVGNLILGNLGHLIVGNLSNLIVCNLGEGSVLLRCGRVRRRKKIWNVSEKGERRAGGRAGCTNVEERGVGGG